MITAWMIRLTPFTSGAVRDESEVLVFPRGLFGWSRRAREHFAAMQDIDNVRNLEFLLRLTDVGRQVLKRGR